MGRRFTALRRERKGGGGRARVFRRRFWGAVRGLGGSEEGPRRA